MTFLATALEYLAFTKTLKEKEGDIVVGKAFRFQYSKESPMTHPSLIQELLILKTPAEVTICIHEDAFVDTADGFQRPVADAIKSMRPSKFWFTTSLTAGIKEVVGHIDTEYPRFVNGHFNGPDSPSAHMLGERLVADTEGREWHRTLEAAEARMEEMRQERRASLKKSILKYEDMVFVPKRRHGMINPRGAVWITRNLGEGILEVVGDHSTESVGSPDAFFRWWDSIDGPKDGHQYAFNEGRDFHRTRAAADARMEVMRQAKIASLTKSLDKLDGRTATPKPRKPKMG